MNELNDEIKKIEKILSEPEKLGTECEQYARISGYYRSTKNWNAGKGVNGELGERLNYKIS